jgi:cytochrome c553
MESRMARTEAIQDAVSKINALRRVTRETGTISKRAQSKVLQALTDEEMTAVAEILAQQSEASNG